MAYSFVDRAREIHRDKYDYSHVNYVNNLVKVEIVCPVHGSFWQTPKKHLAGQGCPHKDCVRAKLERTNKRKYDVARPLQSKEIRDLCVSTNMRVYGVRNPSLNDAVNQKRVKTCREKYGVDYSCEAPSVVFLKEKTNIERYGGISPFCSNNVRSKAVETIRRKYGVSCVFSSPIVWDKIRQTNIEKYGCPYATMSNVIKSKIRQTLLLRYGVDEPFKSKEIYDKGMETKRLLGTVSSSGPENMAYCMLVDIFGYDNVERHCKSEAYPFHCDFRVYDGLHYLYIEMNLHWTHGGHYFDQSSEFDLQKLWQWYMKFQKGSAYYQSAIDVWTRSDLLKRDTAISNGLIYLVFWDNDLSDFKQWIMDGCPVECRGF